MGFNADLERFNKGINFESYRTLGCHAQEIEGTLGYRFTVWAPHAKDVCVVGDFINWDTGIKMTRVGETGVWTVFCEGVKEGDCYKYRVTQQDGTIKLKIDPFSHEFEVRPKEASIVKTIQDKKWKDSLWMANRKRMLNRPIHIYEIHLNSWKTHPDGSWYTLNDLQDELIPYVKEMGYTHIQFLPIMEHPLDASWGYQITGFYAVSSKFGSIEAFQDFVEACHHANIGVLLDFVPAHFNRNDYALPFFDGTPQFEYQDVNKAYNNRWGTMNFDLGKPEVQSFLISNALFWIEQFHIDGLRVDAVSSMLYLDFDIGDWTPNEDGTNHNKEGIAFLQTLNTTILDRHPDVLMIAEESSAWPIVTGPVKQGGLGFTYKWNMGWMNDTLRFFEMDPIYRKFHFDLITFSFVYMFQEHYILPFSHDEVVHGKKSLMHKMHGDRYNQFAGLRTMLAWMMTHPGKKLNFMGNEFGQFIEWRYNEGLKWDSLEDEMNHKQLHFMNQLNHLYKKEKSLWELENEKGIEIIHVNEEESNLAFIRKGKKSRDFLIVIFNFVPVERHHFQVGVPYEGIYEELMNTEMKQYGGTWEVNQGILKTKREGKMNQNFSVEIILPALSCVILKPKRVLGANEGGKNNEG